MGRIDQKYMDLGYLDRLALQNTFVHRLDPRAKVLTTVLFIVTVVSFDKYALSGLIPFLLFPATLIGVGNLPVGYLLKKIGYVLPFALLVGLFNPFFDREIIMSVEGIAISGGWISFGSILCRFGLTVLAALVLIATTSFVGVCRALQALGLPQIFTLQLLFLYRYLFVLVEEGGRMARAREVRSFGRKGMGAKVFASLVGYWLLRTLDRAQRINMAMHSRGFTGEFQLRHPLKFGLAETVFVAGWSVLFMLFRLLPLPNLIGRLFLSLLGGMG